MTKQKISSKLVIKDKKSTPKKVSGYGIGMKISLDLLSSVLVGAMIGLGIDNFFNKTYIFINIFGIRCNCRFIIYINQL